MTDKPVDVPVAKINGIFGYDGLPLRFLVQSQYGYLGANSFTTLDRATIFQSRKSARITLAKLYPDAILKE